MEGGEISVVYMSVHIICVWQDAHDDKDAVGKCRLG